MSKVVAACEHWHKAGVSGTLEVLVWVGWWSGNAELFLLFSVDKEGVEAGETVVAYFEEDEVYPSENVLAVFELDQVENGAEEVLANHGQQQPVMHCLLFVEIFDGEQIADEAKAVFQHLVVCFEPLLSFDFEEICDVDDQNRQAFALHEGQFVLLQTGL
jgi:hypothetical protein